VNGNHDLRVERDRRERERDTATYTDLHAFALNPSSAGGKAVDLN